MASASKGKRIKVRLKSTAGTGYFKTTEVNKFNREQKNPGQDNKKLRLKKYDPRIRKVVEFVEDKIK